MTGPVLEVGMITYYFREVGGGPYNIVLTLVWAFQGPPAFQPQV